MFNCFCDDNDPKISFSKLRIQKNSEGNPTALQTPILHFSGSIDDHSVDLDLIGTIHLGEADYYADINRRFQSYDSVCVEMILPEKAKLSQVSSKTPTKKSSFHTLDIVPMTQTTFSRFLQLVPQISAIDYSQPNLVVADLTQEEVEQLFAQSEEMDNVPILIMSTFFSTEEWTMEDLFLALRGVKALLAHDQKKALRRFFAEMFLETSPPQNDTPFENLYENILIKQRNQAAIEQILEEITSGKSKIALFYGTDHLSDLSDRLQDLGLTITGCEWLDAWQLQ